MSTGAQPDPLRTLEADAATILISPAFWGMAGAELLDLAGFLSGQTSGQTAVLAGIGALSAFILGRAIENHGNALAGKK